MIIYVIGIWTGFAIDMFIDGSAPWWFPMLAAVAGAVALVVDLSHKAEKERKS